MSTACVHKESSMGEGKEGKGREGSEHPFPRSGGCNCYLLSASIVPFPFPDRHLPPLPYLTLPFLLPPQDMNHTFLPLSSIVSVRPRRSSRTESSLWSRRWTKFLPFFLTQSSSILHPSDLSLFRRRKSSTQPNDLSQIPRPTGRTQPL